ncbi:MAG: nitrate reductase associated protein [Nostocaceae cyanobacterium]|nr:nitrate reductase associated protein [Nostocaceae cyanobacterium]
MTFFQFEADFVNSLRCIPMQVRYKLDTCGIKLKLSDWNQMNQPEREALVETPCSSESEIQSYREYLQDLILQRSGEPAKELPIDPHPVWMDSTNLPDSVQQQALLLGVTLTPQEWSTLTPLQRFALLKLSRPGHENRNFAPALKEFNLI